MISEVAALTALVEQLQLQNTLQQETITLLNRKNEALEQENRLLRQKVDLLVRRCFGAKSEALNPNQLELLPTGFETTPPPGKSEASGAAVNGDTLEAVPASHTLVPVKTSRRPRLPEHLPVVEEIIDPAPVLADPEAFRRIGGERTGQLDYTPGRFLRRVIIRGKYVPLDNPHTPPVIAPLSVLQERGLAAPGLLAHIIVAKFCDHLPLYWLEQIFKTRHGILLPRQTMARWLALAAFWLGGLQREIKNTVLENGYVQIDETPVRYLEPGNGKTGKGYLWAVHRPGGDTVFHWFTSRGAACFEAILLENWRGTIQCDGYSAYEALVKKRPGIILASCMAHIRRGFFEAKEEAPVRAGWILRRMGHLYRLEERLRERKASPRMRKIIREAEAAPILSRIKKALLLFRQSGRHLPQGAFGKALSYALGQWDGLTPYLEDGRVEIDNNPVENAIRPTAVGKKNWLFIGDAGAGETAAILYTVIESARRRGIDPEAWLTDFLTRLPSMPQQELPNFTAAAWADSRKKAA